MKYSNHFDVKRKIELLKKLSVRNAKPDEFAPVLQDLLFDKHEIKGLALDQPIYRARRNESGRLFADIGELKYPQSPLTKGRMNDVGEPFFYGALCELGTIYEMVPAIGSLFTISKINKQKGNPIFMIAGLLDDPRSPAPKNSTEKAIYDYLHGEFTKVTTTAEEYNSTIAISRLLLSKGFRAKEGSILCGLAYPSVQVARGVANVRTFNIGMKGEKFDDNFFIRDAFVYCLTHELESYQLNELNRGEIAADGSLNWTYSFAEMQRRMRSGLTSDGSFVEKLKSHAGFF